MTPSKFFPQPARYAAIGCLALALLCPTRVEAAWAQVANAVVDDPCEFRRDFTWTFPAAGLDNAAGGLGGGGADTWVVVSINSPAPGGGAVPLVRDLEVTAQHQSGGAQCDAGHGRNPAAATMPFPNVARPPVGPQVRAVAHRIPHGDHADYFSSILRVPQQGDLMLRVHGKHDDDVTAAATHASIHNQTGRALTVTFIPSYRQADGTVTFGDPIEVGRVGNGRTKNKELPREPGTGNLPTNYRVVAFGSPVSDTTLAFRGEVAGVGANELELAPMIQLLGTRSADGGAEILAPMLRDPAEEIGLYVSVDLTQWVGSGQAYEPGQTYTLVEGVNEALPGYFVSTTPIPVDGEGGTPYTGTVYVAATIDGTADTPTDDCRLGEQPAATLLVPYFDLDLADRTRTTLTSVVNVAGECTLARVTLWTDLAVPTLTFYLYMSPHDVQTLNLFDLFAGELPDTSAVLGNPECGAPSSGGVCEPAALAYRPTAGEVAALRAAHTGAPDPVRGDCAAVDRGDQVAVGYLTVDAAPSCALPPSVASHEHYRDAIADAEQPFFAMTNHLVGDVFHVDGGENFAQGEPVVHLLADRERFGAGDYTFYGRYTGFDGSDARVPLSSSWGTRFLAGGDFDGGTELHVWRDTLSPEVAPFPCGTLPPWAPLGHAGLSAVDEAENPVEVDPTLGFPWAVQRLPISDRVAAPFGWLELDLAGADATLAPAWVSSVMSARGRFSVGLGAVALDDLCGQPAPLPAEPAP